jgi:class 3 adenylate cyclase/tetratricopeptide (TPR) repeat protein
LAAHVAAPSVAAPPSPSNGPSAPRAERRQLTVLFCDLVGSTALAGRLDLEDLRDVIGAYHRLVADSAARFDGFVARYMGDGALVYFGYPRAHEDNAERAVRAALMLMSQIGKLVIHNEHLTVRVGIATGLVVVGELVNAGASKEETALGETPNLAARLQAYAQGGTILIDDHSKRLIGESFECCDLGTLFLKGFRDGVRAWQVEGDERVQSRLAAYDSQTPLDAPPAATTTPLVGREHEIGLLRNRWQAVCDGHGHIVLLTGDAGIGKSRLIAALVSTITPQPHYELEFHCSAYHVNSPLYPVINLLPGVIGFGRDESDEAKVAKLKAFCSEHGLSQPEGLPLLVSLLSLPAPAGFSIPPMSPERQKQRTLQALLAIALSFAAERPLLMVVEDLQWIDPTTMELLELLIQKLPRIRVFATFTARAPFELRSPPRAHTTTVLLTRFTERETAEMIDRVALGRPLPAEVVKQITAKTDGVPLFIEELTKAVLESRSVEESAADYRPGAPFPSLAIPTTLQDSLMARLDRLGTGKAVAQLGAVLGREFSYSMLKAVAMQDEATLQRELLRLVEAEFLQQRGVPPESTYIFKHALIQEAAYQSLLRSTRQRYHERIAQVVVDQFAADAAAHPEFPAMHYTEAANFDAAVRWWRKAGQHAFQRASYAEAINHYGRGLEVLQSLPESSNRDQLELELQVELGYALIPVKGWVASESARAFTRAGELCREIGDAPKLFRALWGIGAFHFVRGDQHRAREIADQGLSVARQANDIDASIEGKYLSGIVSCAMGRFVPGIAELEECIRLYGSETRERHRALYGQDAKASAMGWLAMALCARGEPDAALAHANEALARVRNATQPFLLARGLAGLGFVLLLRGEARAAQPSLEAAIALCSEQNFVYFHAVVSAFHGAALAHLGNASEGVALMQSSIVKLRTIGSELLFTAILAHLAAGHLTLSQFEEGADAIKEGLHCVKTNGERWGEAELYRIGGLIHLAQGSRHTADAQSCFEKALEVSGHQQARSYKLRAAMSLAQLWAEQKKRTAAQALLSEAIGAWPDTADSAELRGARDLRAELV